MYFGSKGYKRFPELTLLISNYPVKFLVDSGATNSVLRAGALPCDPKKSGKTCVTIGSSGVPIIEDYSVPLKCKLEDQIIKHSFLLSQSCPINLMGRDLMCKFGIVLHSAPEGISVSRQAQEPLYQMIKGGPEIFLYTYEWKLDTPTVASDLT